MDEKTKKILRREAELRGLVFEQKENSKSDFVEMISHILHSRNQVHVLHIL